MLAGRRRFVLRLEAGIVYNVRCRAGVAQLPRAPAFQAGGRGLESRRPLQFSARSSGG